MAMNLTNCKSFSNLLLSDVFETSSNTSDNHSEHLSSSLSSLSGLTGYEEELSDLKHLIKLSPSATVELKENTSTSGHLVEVYEERINKLNCDLQNSLKANVECKNEISNLRRKIELEFYEKFEKLLQNNAQLEGELVVAKEQVRGLLTNKNVASSDSLVNKVAELESKIKLLKNEVGHWKKEASIQEDANNQLKIEVEELKMNMNGKNNSIEALKRKIVELHVDMQNLNQENVRVCNSLTLSANNLQLVKKSELWYKEQLYQCRGEKSKLSEEVSESKLLLASKERNLDMINSDLNKLKAIYEQFQLNAQHEKRELLKTINVKNPPIIIEDNPASSYEFTIETLTRELMMIKEAIKDHQASFDSLNKQNSELIAKNTLLEKTLRDKEIILGNLEYDKEDLNAKLEIFKEKQKQAEQLINSILNNRSRLEIALNGANQEKCEVQEVVAMIRENFTKLVCSYNKIKEELSGKNREIFENCLEIEKLKSDVMHYQEEARVCKGNITAIAHEVNLKDSFINEQQKELSNLEAQLKAKDEKLNSEVTRYTEDVRVLKGNITSISHELDLKNSMINEKEKEINALKTQAAAKEENLKSEVICSKQTLNAQKEELEALTQELSVFKNELKLKDDVIHSKNAKITNLESEVMSMSEANMNLEYSVNEASHLNKLLKLENNELNDKLVKFVANNFNGFNNNREFDKLESWLLQVLNAISTNLKDINACGMIDFSVKFPSNNGKFKNCLEQINNSFLKLKDQQERLNRDKLKSKLLTVVNKLEGRISHLENQHKKDLAILDDLKLKNEHKLAETIKQLKALVKAKELENKEKQRRYEINNRTLLRKVKEHMRGRNAAEKHCAYLQELHNNVCDELNNYKLKDGSKDSEIQNLQNLCENYKNLNNKLKEGVLSLQKELSMLTAKYNFASYELLKENLCNVEEKLKAAQENINLKDVMINKLQIEVQDTLLKYCTLEKENVKQARTIEHLKENLNEQIDNVTNLKFELEENRKIIEELQEKFLNEQKNHSATLINVQNEKQTSQFLQERNDLLNEEINLLNHKLDTINQELSDFQVQKIILERDWKQNHFQSLLTNLQLEIQTLQNDLVSVNSDKNFLQRLCNDLKLALETSMNQSKVLKKQIQGLTSGSSTTREYNSLPDTTIDFPSPTKYDEDHINRLLKQSSAPLSEKPLSDLEKCLNSLKQEMICLRKQVTESVGYQI